MLKKTDTEKSVGNIQIEASNFKNASIYVKKLKRQTIVTLIDENTTFNIAFTNIDNVDVLRIVFLDYLSNYSGGYTPNSQINDQKYQKIVHVLTKKDRNIFPELLDIIATTVISVITVCEFNLSENKIETIAVLVPFFLLPKLCSSFASGKKSRFSNILLVLLFCLFYIAMSGVLGNQYYQPDNELTMFIAFTIVSIIFLLVNFDKLLKVVISAVTVIVALGLSWYLFLCFIK